MNLWQEAAASGFDWDAGNRDKIWQRHAVTTAECEEVFYGVPIFGGMDDKHSFHESRYYVYGQTKANRPLFVIYTLRAAKIRVISAREMNRKERQDYYEAAQRAA